MSNTKPLLIDLTPVFNEAWVLPAFLKATSLWADYIIIADQMSTDGSRELYAQFSKEEHINLHGRKCKLIVIDNPRKEMHQAATRRLLFEEAKKIDGDKILFTLDADEFLSGNFPETEGWQTIINSEPGDVFEFRWMNLTADTSKYSTWQPYYWAAHLDKDLLNGEFPDNFIHEWRLPWPNHVNHEYEIEDISFIHFARVNVKRQRNKERFYQVSQSVPLKKYSGVGFYRQYHPLKVETLYAMPNNAYDYYKTHNVDIQGFINLSDEGKHYTLSVLQNFEKKGKSFFSKLDVWDNEFLEKNNLKDPRTFIDKFIHRYLRWSNPYSKSFVVRGIDKILKKIY